MPSSTASPGRPPGVWSREGLGAIENALLDAKAKALGVPCYVLLGGKVRDRVRVYWSHCATWRINHPTLYKPAITSLDGVTALGAEVREKGFTALKTNIFLYEGGAPRGWRPGFGVPFLPELNVDKHVLRNLRTHLAAMREGAGPDVDLLLDLNFNAKTEGYLKILKAIADFDMFWVEIDSYSPEALGYIRRQSPHPISSCETLLGLREFLPYFREQAMDVAIIDAVWNGVWQAMKIATAAEAFEVNIAPHNFYGHLATMMNAHFAAAIAEFAHHGDRHRPPPLGRRSVHHRAAIRERPSRGPRHAGLGHRTQRGSDPRPPAKGARRPAALPAALSGTLRPRSCSGSRLLLVDYIISNLHIDNQAPHRIDSPHRVRGEDRPRAGRAGTAARTYEGDGYVGSFSLLRGLRGSVHPDRVRARHCAASGKGCVAEHDAARR